jgi:hypothetical protein
VITLHTTVGDSPSVRGDLRSWLRESAARALQSLAA